MAKGYGAEALAQLEFGAGEVLYGDGGLVMLKALLEAGVAYMGGYPGSPVAHLMDAVADAYPRYLQPRGFYFDQSANEATAAALLAASLTEPVRGAVCWKHNGNTVGADALNHLSLVGIRGGALVVVGEDYGLESSAAPLRTPAMARSLLMPCFDPRCDLQLLADLVAPAYALSEAAGLPVFFMLRSRIANLRDRVRCKDNQPLPISAAAPAPTWQRDPRKYPLRPHNLNHRREQAAQRLPRATAFIHEHGLNEHFSGRCADVGIITHGSTYNVTMRALELLGLTADGTLPVPLLQLNVVYPLVPAEIEAFLAGKRAVLIVEEGNPDFLEGDVRAIAHRAGLAVQVHSRDRIPEVGELTPEQVFGPLAEFVGAALPDVSAATLAERAERSARATAAAQALFAQPVVPRPPTFCTGCPERPIFAALKLLEAEVGEVPYYAGDVGCYGMSIAPPFGIGDSNVGMGMGLASGAGVARFTQQKVVSFMGDGTFWHNGLNTSIASAAYNHQNSTLVIFENYWTALTGDHENPSSGKNMKGQDVGPNSIVAALRGVGVRWVQQVRSYRVGRVKELLREAIFGRGAAAPELKVVVAQGECILANGRRIQQDRARRLAAGRRVAVTRYGVDPEVCTTCHACMRYNGCPSLTLGTALGLKDRPHATIDAGCSGCGLCGELAHAGALCPSFYHAETIANPTLWDRLSTWVVNRLARKGAA